MTTGKIWGSVVITAAADLSDSARRIRAAAAPKPLALLPEPKPQQRPVYRWKGARKRGGRS